MDFCPASFKRSRPLRYGLCALLMSMLHSLFTSFYVDYFVRQRLATTAKVAGSTVAPMQGSNSTDTSPATQSEGDSSQRALLYFIIGQIGYAAWNGLNDLGFGWLGDTRFSLVTRRRFQRLCYGGPFWAASFALLWLPIDIPFLHPAVQFTLLMVIYDGFFSYASVSFRALLCDIATDTEEREKCNSVAAVFHVIGSIGVGIASYLYESPSLQGEQGGRAANLTAFRWFMTIWAFAAGVGFYVATQDVQEVSLVASDDKPAASHKVDDNTQSDMKRFWAFVVQTTNRTSMRAVLFVWALQDYSCTFATNFFSLFLVAVCGETIGAPMRSIFLLFSFVMPHAITIIATPFYRTVGKKRVAAIFFAMRGVVGIMCLVVANEFYNATSVVSLQKPGGGVEASEAVPTIAGMRLETAFCALLFTNRILTEAVCRMQGLILSDITDEDTVLYGRNHSMAAALNGLVSLVSKPFQSVAPIITCIFLAQIGVIASDSPQDVQHLGSGSRKTIGAVTAFFGINAVVTSFAMLFAWTRWYELDGKHFQFIQQAIRKRQMDDSSPI